MYNVRVRVGQDPTMKKSELEPLGSQPPEIWQEVNMKVMQGLEKLRASQRGLEGISDQIPELRTHVEKMLECADQMILQIPEVVLRDIGTCTKFVDVNLRLEENDTEREYTVSYYQTCEDDIDVYHSYETEF